MMGWRCRFAGCYLAGQALSLHCSHGPHACHTVAVCPVHMQLCASSQNTTAAKSRAARLLFCCKLTTT